MVLFATAQTRETSWLVNLLTWQEGFPPMDQPLKLPMWLLRAHTGGALAYPYGGTHFGSVATAWMVIHGCIALGWSRYHRAQLLLMLGPLPFAFMAAALHRYPYGASARTMLYMAPAFCYLAGRGLDAGIQLLIPARYRVPTVISAIIVLVTIPVGGIVLDVLMPYKSRDDLRNRQIALWLSSQSRPGDRWIVFNGATPPPQQADLMIQRWMQQVGELRYDLLRYAQVPVEWEPDPTDVEPSPKQGETWLIVHQPGRTSYPYEQLEAYIDTLTARLGPSRSMRFLFPRSAEYVEVLRFGGVADRAAPDRDHAPVGLNPIRSID
jgi:hypothetical protein